MKLRHYLILASVSTLAACSSGTKKENNATSKGNTESLKIDTNVTVQDTFFISRATDPRNQVVHSIYVDPDKDSHKHDWIFSLDSRDNSNLKNYLTQLLKGGHKLAHVNLGDFPTEWRPVYRLKGKYYLYDPNDHDDKNTMRLTDSVLMSYLFGDGYDPIAIASFQRKSDKWVVIKTEQYPGIDNSNPAEVNIYTIDRNTGLSVWVMGDDAELMVPKQGLSSYPVIVNRSMKSKYPEFEFDSFDAKTLISK